jgi:activating signal cointegrator 1
MKALTICQPYAHLIATGEKRVENRTWQTFYRGMLYIHAGKSLEWLTSDPPADMPFGAIVAVATLADCVHIDKVGRGMAAQRWPWLAEHEHTNGPWCWVLANVHRVKPLPWKGAQGLWECPAVTESLTDSITASQE